MIPSKTAFCFTTSWLVASFVAGCSGDASLGSDKHEQGVNPDGSADDGGSGTDGVEATGGSSATHDTSATSGTTASGGSGPTGTSDAATSGGHATGGGGATGGSSGDDTSGGHATGGGGATGGSGSVGVGGGPADDTSTHSSSTTGDSTTSDSTTGDSTTGDSTTGDSTTGTGGGPSCETGECLRPYECVEHCGGPVLYTGCCPCDEGLLDQPIECEDTTTSCLSDQECTEGTYCAYPAEHACGGDAVTGSCHGKPEVCTADYSPVCGCDGETYSNACGAASQGVNVSAAGECPEL